MNKLNLSELTLDNMSQWPVSLKAGMVLVTALTAIAFGYWFVVKSNVEHYERIKKEESALKITFDLKQRQSASLNQHRHQLLLMQKKFAAMPGQLPAKHEMPGLLEDISKTGMGLGLRFELFAPHENVEHDLYIELPIKIIVIGDYYQIAIFLNRVAHMGRLVTMHDFVLERALSKDKNETSVNGLRMEMTAKIYRYRTQ